MTASTNNIEQLRTSIRNGETTARSAALFALDAAEKLNDTLNAFLQIDRAGALARAEEIDASGNNESAKGAALAGIPIAIKDNICVRGLQTS